MLNHLPHRHDMAKCCHASEVLIAVKLAVRRRAKLHRSQSSGAYLLQLKSGGLIAILGSVQGLNL
ncbi:hypothetical protein SLEP1_g25635 [Rubroshorea leprosula]|uniref:Uncharacterized protein n=1 Tax=Rubroshorea leprosula TaxID=152421 RepID=A0AAV5JQW0_9ROSI|nr:hypothetical protein SLEP1_g25635 [Rubroshorea leprosula]